MFRKLFGTIAIGLSVGYVGHETYQWNKRRNLFNTQIDNEKFSFHSFKSFNITKTISKDRNRIIVLGKYHGKDAVMFLYPTPTVNYGRISSKMEDEELTRQIQSWKTCEKVKQNENNLILQVSPKENVVEKFRRICNSSPSFRYRVSIQINPTEESIKKLSKKSEKVNYHFVNESYEEYLNFSLPELEKVNIKWVENILNSENEGEKVLYDHQNEQRGWVVVENPYFWRNKNDAKELYYNVFFRDEELKTIRDLSSKDISMLENVKTLCCEKIMKKYPNIGKDEIRFYFHYHPSVPRLHLHINHISKFNFQAHSDKALSLEDVLTKLSVSGTYFKDQEIRISLKNNSQIFENFQECRKNEKEDDL